MLFKIACLSVIISGLNYIKCLTFHTLGQLMNSTIYGSLCQRNGTWIIFRLIMWYAILNIFSTHISSFSTNHLDVDHKLSFILLIQNHLNFTEPINAVDILDGKCFDNERSLWKSINYDRLQNKQKYDSNCNFWNNKAIATHANKFEFKILFQTHPNHPLIINVWQKQWSINVIEIYSNGPFSQRQRKMHTR